MSSTYFVSQHFDAGPPEHELARGVEAGNQGCQFGMSKPEIGTLHWYVIHTKVRQEQTACENLTRQGYVIYFPKIKQLRSSRGRQKIQMEPMFPRYIFLQPESVAHSIAPVRSTLGVTSLVRFGEEPAVIRAETICAIKEFEVRQNMVSDKDIDPFQRGVRIRIANGRLAGMEGLISVVSRDRVTVLMHLLGQDTRVNLCRHQLALAH